ncbi:MAG: V-type ATP synthase subunit F [Clostridiales bacterium]|jgi:V/A-type H+-transporting ATPase subunit F|nr:V-type ATP synthase subunit F [Clostridiales bacterium]MDD2571949.1 V-type ATP synthase subunit F [Eubacteriales bacterium]MDY0119692.1 V-type ATP synthase subunit F [Clostridia bacterium]NLG29948.1 V-type ATP synthase subunit F [Clostridiaceae bacterium]MCK9349799.1 V-type ATP synthase subunit F [Clostridiales bacterium]
MEQKIGVIGEWDSILGFRALGLSTMEVTDPEKAEDILKCWAEEDYAVIFVTEILAKKMGARLASWRQRYLPIVTVIPSARERSHLGRQELRTAIRKATGIDMIGQRDKAREEKLEE